MEAPPGSKLNKELTETVELAKAPLESKVEGLEHKLEKMSSKMNTMNLLMLAQNRPPPAIQLVEEIERLKHRCVAMDAQIQQHVRRLEQAEKIVEEQKIILDCAARFLSLVLRQNVTRVSSFFKIMIN